MAHDERLRPREFPFFDGYEWLLVFGRRTRKSGGRVTRTDRRRARRLAYMSGRQIGLTHHRWLEAIE